MSIENTNKESTKAAAAKNVHAEAAKASSNLHADAAPRPSSPSTKSEVSHASVSGAKATSPSNENSERLTKNAEAAIEKHLAKTPKDSKDQNDFKPIFAELNSLRSADTGHFKENLTEINKTLHAHKFLPKMDIVQDNDKLAVKTVVDGVQQIIAEDSPTSGSVKSDDPKVTHAAPPKPETAAATNFSESGFAPRTSGTTFDRIRDNGGFNSDGQFVGAGNAGDGTVSFSYPTSDSSSGNTLSAGEQVQAKAIYDYLIQRGFSPAAASGILGNMMVESGLRTDNLNPNEGAIGFCQWEGDRRTALESFATANGKSVTDWHVQIDFMMHELQTNESGAYAKLKSAQTPREAAAVFDQCYERSSGEARAQRMQNADDVYKQVATA